MYKHPATSLSYAFEFLGNLPQQPFGYAVFVCVGVEQRVVGMHLIGKNSDEMVQGFAFALKLGFTKSDLDSMIGVHPTIAKEAIRGFPDWSPKSGLASRCLSSSNAAQFSAQSWFERMTMQPETLKQLAVWASGVGIGTAVLAFCALGCVLLGICACCLQCHSGGAAPKKNGQMTLSGIKDKDLL